MITSSTLLLAQGHILSTDEINPNEIQQKASFVTHYNSLFFYFLRLSHSNKVNFIRKLLQSIRSIGSISLIINTMYAVISKVNIYILSLKSIDNAYDKVLFDHNRMLDDKHVESLMASDIIWFETLSDREQESIVIALSRNGGGAVIRSIYWACYKEYNMRLHMRKKSTLKNVTDKDIDDTEKKEEIKPKIETKYDMNNELDAQCVKQKKEWEQMIGKYRLQIFGKQKKEKPIKKEKKTKKEKKGDKKKEKKSKKSKDKNKKNQVEYDTELIELMPISIVKRIFSYLDMKTLKKARKVDAYWNYAVNDYLRDLKTRKYANKIREQLENALDPQFNNKIEPIQMEKKCKSFHEQKMQKLVNRGAILEKLRYTNMPLTKHNILYEAVMVLQNENAKDVEYQEYRKLSMFPRVARAHIPIVKPPQVIYKDVDVILELPTVEDPDEEHELSQPPSKLESLTSNCTIQGSYTITSDQFIV